MLTIYMLCYAILYCMAPPLLFWKVRADGEGVLGEAASSGTTDEPELFKFPGGGVKAKKIRFVGLGSM